MRQVLFGLDIHLDQSENDNPAWKKNRFKVARYDKLYIVFFCNLIWTLGTCTTWVLFQQDAEIFYCPSAHWKPSLQLHIIPIYNARCQCLISYSRVSKFYCNVSTDLARARAPKWQFRTHNPQQFHSNPGLKPRRAMFFNHQRETLWPPVASSTRR